MTPERPLVRSQIHQEIPLTQAQLGILHAQQLAGSVPIAIALYVEITGPLEVDLLFRALRQAGRELGSGYIRISEVDGKPVQWLDQNDHDDFTFHDLRTSRDPAAEAMTWMRSEYCAPFDVYRDLLARSAILHVEEERFFWYLRVHHVALDGVGGMTLAQRAADVYSALKAGTTSAPCAALPIDMFAEIDQQYRSSQRCDDDQTYWRAKLSEASRPTGMAGRFAPATMHPRVARAELSAPLVERLEALARSANSSLATVFVSAVATFLARMTGDAEVTLSLPVSARTTKRLRESGGMLANVVPIRAPVDAAGSVTNLIRAVQLELTGALRHQRYRSEDIARDSGIPTDDGSHFGPMVSILLNENVMSFGPSRGRTHVLTAGLVDDLYFILYPGAGGGGLDLDLHVNGALYSEREMRSHHSRFVSFLDRFADGEGQQRASCIKVVDAEENQHLVSLTGPPLQVPLQTLAELLTTSAVRYPHTTAVRANGRSITYRDLDERSNALAVQLSKRGARPESVVALRLPRSIDYFVAQWAVAKTGAALLALDIAHPRERLAAMIDESGATLGVSLDSDTSLASIDWLSPEVLPDPIPFVPQTPALLSNSAYIIFTSGSTGKPKGVQVTHRGLSAMVQGQRETVGPLAPGSRVLAAASPAFDAHIWEVLLAHASGSTLVAAPLGASAGPQLTELLAFEKITHAALTPSVLATLDPAEVRVPTLVTAGESIGADLLARWAPGRSMRNQYGPAECTVVCASSDRLTPHGPATIGRAMPEFTTLVLDRQLQPVPPGRAGELWISGPGLARGYLHRFGLTASSFVANPYGGAGDRMYRTGDLARWTVAPDGMPGELEFLGRNDFQVKIRGMRIELGEVDATLSAHSSVQHAVTVGAERNAHTVLASYVVPKLGTEVDVSALFAHIAATLPRHMVPAAITVIDQVPITAMGKLDRGALPEPAFANAAYRAPRNQTEKILAEIVGELLGTATVGIDDDFIALGGDSISAIQAVARAKLKGLLLNPRDILEQRTIVRIAAQSHQVANDSPVLAELPGAGCGIMPAPIAARHLLETVGRVPGAFDRLYHAAEFPLPESVTSRTLHQAIQTVIDRHDQLRSRLLDIDGSPHVEVLPASQLPPVHIGVVQVRDSAAVDAALAAAADRLAPRSGVVTAFVRLIRPGDADSLLVVVHHLVIDGVSWRILAQDLAAEWTAASREASTSGPITGTSMRRWMYALTDLAATLPHDLWRKTLEGPDPLLSSRPVLPTRDRSTRSIAIQLDAATTEVLTTEIPVRFKATTHDVIVAATALALARQLRQSTFPIQLEGHGRDEQLVPGADLATTVGWFTSVFPVRVDLGGIDVAQAFLGGPTTSDVLKKVKEQLRQSPEPLTYGLLRYFSNADLPDRLPGQARVNYLGRIPRIEGVRSPWELMHVHGGDVPASVAIDINAIVSGSELLVDFAYPPTLLSEPLVTGFAADWVAAVQAIAACVAHPDSGGYTPSDFALVRAEQADIDRWGTRYPQLIDIWPLTPLQQGFYLLSRLAEDAVDVYTPQTVITLRGQVQVDRLRWAAQQLIDSFDILRAAFTTTSGGAPVQVVLDHVELRWQEALLDDRSEFDEFLRADRLAGFDLAAPPLLRFALVRLAHEPSVHHLVMTNHHILLDGWSLPLLLGRLMAEYTSAPTSAAVPFRDYLTWLADQDSTRATEQWRVALDGAIPTYLASPAVKSAHDVLPGQHIHRLDEAQTRALYGAAARAGVTTNTLIQTAWALLLCRLTGQQDVVFGTTVSGRPPELADSEAMVGLLINTVAVRVCIDETEKVDELLVRVQHEQIALFSAHHIGLSQTGGAGLFDTHVVFESYPIDVDALAAEFAGLRIVNVDANEATHYPLSLSIRPGAQIAITATFGRQHFSDSEVSLITARYVRVLESICTHGPSAVGAVEVLDESEADRIVRARNATAVQLPYGRTLISMFRRQVDQSPDAPAIGAGTTWLTYREFDARINQIAQWLRHNGVRSESTVVVCLPRSIEQIATIYAILAAGGTYVPADPQWPADRLQALIELCRPRLVISSAVDASGHSCRRLPPSATEGNIAYILFTSGSTGKPKGVAVSHGSIANRLSWMQSQYPLSKTDVVLQKTPATFDVSVWELFWPLQAGARIAVAEPDVHRDPAALSETLHANAVTVVHFVPSMLAAFADYAKADSHLRLIFASGEALPPQVAHRVRNLTRARVHNLYGPTEAAVDVTYHEVSSRDVTSVPIGRPVWNTQVYVLDDRLRPVPDGVAGELYIGGVQVARGYHGQPGLTAERFVANSFSRGSRLYRTGDIVRWNAAGELEYLGRNDFQVKLRGQRIELGEIEFQLGAINGVRQATALVRDVAGVKQLVAYVVSAELDEDQMRTSLAARLPTYMVPDAIVRLPSFPVTRTGKLDRAALPDPSTSQAPPRLPQTPVERVIAAAVAEVLERGSVPVNVSVFKLGINSLSAAQIAARMETELHVHIPLRVFFEARTVEAIAAWVQGQPRRHQLPLEARPRDGVIPLSPAQERIWFLHHLEPDSSAQHIAFALRIDGQLDTAAMRSAISDVIERHEILRTVYPEIDGSPSQLVLNSATVELPIFSGPEVDLVTSLDALAHTPFDLSAEPPIRIALFALEQPLLAVVAHHIAADGFSLVPLTRDLAKAYDGRLENRAPFADPLPIQFLDCALWLRDLLGSRDDSGSLAAQQEKYWRQQLDGLAPLLELPTDRARPAVASQVAATHRVTVGGHLVKAVTALAESADTTPFTVLHAGLALLLARLSRTTDIAVGTPVSGRGVPAMDDLIGMFVNTVVLRTPIDLAEPFTALLERVQATDVGALNNAHLPFEKVVEAVDPPRSQAHAPLVQVMLTYQNTPVPDFRFTGFSVSLTDIPRTRTMTDLSLILTPQPDGTLTAEFDYATDLFDPVTVESIAQRYVSLLEHVTAHPSAIAGDISIVSASELSVVDPRVRAPVTDTRDFEHPASLIELFNAQAAKTPDAAAVICGEASVTYGELHIRIDDFARRLIGLGAGPETRVAVALAPSIDLVVAMYATLTAGAVYVPLDPDQPAARIDYILEIAQPTCIVASSPASVVSDLPIIVMEASAPDVAGSVDRKVWPRLDNTAYVIFTSGSTGKPKGVAVSHRSIVNQILWMTSHYEISNADVYFQKTASTFDVSMWGYWLPLLRGASLVIAHDEEQRDPHHMLSSMAKYGVTLTDFVPTLLAEIIANPLLAEVSTLRDVFVIGESLSAQTVADWHRVSSARLHNLYGPTEAAVSVSYWQTSESDTTPVPIGSAQSNVELLVLDDRLHPVPPGVIGELYIGGIQVGRGYLAQPALTAERFIANPFGSNAVQRDQRYGDRLYRTGDLARRRRDGVLEFVGRSDAQVKLRGQRVELTEIEAALQTHPDVSQAAVAVHDTPQGQQLSAYFVAHSPNVAPSDNQIETGQLRDHVRQFLPSYMLPGSFTALDSLPLNSSGKLDRSLLPAPTWQRRKYRSATTSLEYSVVRAFGEILGCDVGLDDDFFELGGNSMAAIRLVARLRALTGRQISVRTLFQLATAAQISEEIARLGATSKVLLARRERPARLPLSRAQQRMWILNRLDPDSPHYNIAVSLRIRTDRTALDSHALQLAFADIVRRHDVLRTIYPSTMGESAEQRVLDWTPVVYFGGIDDVDPFTAQGFDVATTAPIRLGAFTSTDDSQLLVLVVHHIAADARSVEVLAKDLVQAYHDRLAGQTPNWSELPVQYADFALWEAETLGRLDDVQSLASTQLAYWKNQLAGAPAFLELPTDRARPTTFDFTGDHFRFDIGPGLRTRLSAVARQHGATVFMVCHAAFAVLLARLSGLQDIPIGAAIPRRDDPALDDMVGMLVNTIVLRVRVTPADTFSKVLSASQNAVLDAFEHADVPFEHLVEELDPERSSAHHPLFQVALAMHEATAPELHFADHSVEVVDPPRTTAKFDLQLTLVTGQHGLSGEFEYATALFDKSTIASFAAMLVRVLNAIADNPQVVTGDINVLSDAESTQLLSSSEAVAAAPVVLSEMLSSAVAANPSGVAVEFAGDRMTYAELDSASERVARALVNLGAGPGMNIALAIQRSLELVVAWWAIAKSGAAFVPIDPSHPAERIGHILSDANISVGLSVSGIVASLPASVTWVDIAGAAGDGSPLAAHTNDVAYIVYTSGSTGQPKGVAVTHAGLANFVAEQRRLLDLSANDRVLGVSSPSFDGSMFELLVAVGARATLVMAPPEIYGGPPLTEFIAQQRISCAFITTAVAASIDPGALRDLRIVEIGGEAVPPDLIRRWQESGCAVLDVYGPTETTIMATASEPLAVGDQITIGRPFRGVTALVLDSRLHPVPQGVVGELYLAGAQLARGYLNRHSLTAERFVANPLAPGRRMYRTGDLVRWTPSGELLFVGRVDFQIKLRGQRIELGEIEARLASLPGVRQSVAVVRGLEAQQHIVAYVTADAPDAAATERELRDGLTAVLPNFMVPQHIVVVPNFPMNSSGKIDRAALPEPPKAVGSQLASSQLERLVARTYAEFLGVEDVWASDSFFAIGGNSLAATQVASIIGAKLGQAIPVRMIFENPTVAALARNLEGLGAALLPDLVRREATASVPLSPAQRRMWLLNRLDPIAPTYNIPLAVRLRGKADFEALQAAVNDVVSRHEVLRTHYPETDSGPIQVVLSDWRPRLAPYRSETLDRVVAEGFDVTIGPPLRVGYFEVSADIAIVCMVIHHIAADGSSLVPLVRDLHEAYRARSIGSAPQWEPLAVQYGDVAIWQNAIVESDIGEQQLSFWRTQLHDSPALLELPYDRPRPPVASSRGAAYCFPVTTDVGALASRLGATDFMVFHAALLVTLSHLSDARDIAIGTPVAGRSDARLSDLVGMFVNTLVLRTQVDLGMSFEDLVARVQEVDLAAFAHADVPFEQIVREVNPIRSQSHSPLFQIMLSVHALDLEDVLDSEFEPYDHGLVTAKCDLQLTIASSTRAEFVYATDLFDEPTIEWFAVLFDRVLTNVATDTTCAVGSLLSVDHLDALQSTSAPANRSTTLASLFESAAEAFADLPALEFEGSTLTYRQFHARVNQTAHWLQAHGVGGETAVVIRMPRSMDMVIAIYGIIMAGAAYVPVDPHWPADRIKHVVDSVRPILEIESLDYSVLDRYASSPITRKPMAHNAAYILFTSGSTGRPKGVTITHAAIANRLLWMQAQYRLNPADVVVHKTPVTFDVSVWELFWPLQIGARLVIAAPEGHRDPIYLDQLFRGAGVTVAHFVPSMLALFADSQSGRARLRLIISSGEALPAALAQRIRATTRAQLHNLYGPTEAAVDVTYHQVTDEDSLLVPIGRPVWNTQLYVLNERLSPLSRRVPGELHLGGVQLARGYHGKPGLTAVHFVANPYGVGERMYRTGDIVRVSDGGELEYLGRTDLQIKLNGQRLELGEIEARLLSASGVAASAVSFQLHVLSAYVVLDGVSIDSVKQFAVQALPEYMRPTRWIAMPALPVTANGKLDRRALPVAPITTPYRSPRTPTELSVVQVLEEILGDSERIGLDSNIFEHGLNSLLAARARTILADRLGKDLPLNAFFTSPIVEDLAAAADEAPATNMQIAAEIVVPIRLTGLPVFFIHAGGGVSSAYAPVASHLADKWSMYGIDSPRLSDPHFNAESIDEYANRYVREIRRVQSSGPYVIAGWSLGGVIAHAVAVKLQAQRLILIDALLEVDPLLERRANTDLLASAGIVIAPHEDISALTPARLLQMHTALQPDLELDQFTRVVHGFAAAGDAIRRYEPDIFSGDSYHVLAAGNLEGSQSWARYLGGKVSEIHVPIRHAELLNPDAIALWAPQLNAWLASPE